MTKSELYAEFLKRFPHFESQITRYYAKDENSLKIYTKYHKSFIFEVTDEGFELHAE